MWQERAQQREEVPGRGSGTQKVGVVEGELVPQRPGRREVGRFGKTGRFLPSNLFSQPVWIEAISYESGS